MSKIIMVSTLGDVWLEPDVAKAVAMAMKKDATSATINGSIYTIRSIQGLLQPETYKMMYVTKKRSWTCQHGSGHAWNDTCQCKTAVVADLNTKALEKKNPLTPEQELEVERKRHANLAWINSFKHNFKDPKFRNKEARHKFIKEFKLPK